MSREFINLIRDFESIFGRDSFPEYNMRVRMDDKEKVLKFNSSVPTLNIFENDDVYRYELVTPGLSKEDIKIEVSDNILTFNGETQTEVTDGEKWVTCEYRHSKFHRILGLPKDINIDEIYAKSENGITKIFVPKKKIKQKDSKKIIKVS
jgi:HSP20 family protein